MGGLPDVPFNRLSKILDVSTAVWASVFSFIKWALYFLLRGLLGIWVRPQGRRVLGTLRPPGLGVAPHGGQAWVLAEGTVLTSLCTQHEDSVHCFEMKSCFLSRAVTKMECGIQMLSAQ